MNDRRDEDRLLDHDYDGIQEYDNPMPRWWLIILWVSVVWSGVYALNIIPGVRSGSGRVQQYEQEMAAARAKFGDPAAAAAGSAVDDSTVRATAADPVQVAAGRQTFTIFCASCHREDAGGNIGPNLTDDYWIHGSRPSQIHGTISRGVLEKGMPAWSAVLEPGQVLSVAAYVTTVRGTHPKQPKASQGVKEEAPHEEGAAPERH